MHCSFVIPAHNEEDWIAGTISAIRAAATELALEYEILVVADACTDRTAEIATELDARVVEVAHRQIAPTRNTGARESAGQLLFFVDGDTQVNTKAVRLALEAMKRGAVGGGSTIGFDGPIPMFMRIAIEISGFLLATARYAGGCFFFCPREAFERAGGFDETLFIAEEIFLARELKKQGRFVIVPARILTSARKVRNHSLREVLSIIWRTFIGGKASCKRREGLDFWYGERQTDPGHSMSGGASKTSNK